MRKSSLAFAVLFLFPLLCIAQELLNNDSVIKMVKAGISDDLVVSTIKSKPGKYDSTVNGIIALKSAGVSDNVVAAIVARDMASEPAPAGASSGSGQSAQDGSGQSASLASQSTQPGPQASDLGSAAAQSFGQIKAGARVVIAPMGGFETYFAAAVREKKVPIALTLDRASAQYFIVSTETEWRGFVAGSSTNADWNQAGGHLSGGSAASSTRGLESSIMLIDSKSKDIVWAYEVHKSSHGALLFGTLAARGQQSLAEACAKHLKEFIDKGK